MHLEATKHILIVAGGSGSRVGSYLPKQFLLLDGKPILFHTINSFLFLDDVEFTIVISPDYIDYWKNLCSQYAFEVPHKIAEGGPTRFHSVKSGLKKISDDSVVLIHDAARPFATKKTILRVLELAKQKGNAIPAIKINSSMREIYGSSNRVVNRDNLREIQTPQGFHSSVIKEAYKKNYTPSFTDDASVLESTGDSINLVVGNPENIKISHAIDLVLAEGILTRIIHKK